MKNVRGTLKAPPHMGQYKKEKEKNSHYRLSSLKTRASLMKTERLRYAGERKKARNRTIGNRPWLVNRRTDSWTVYRRCTDADRGAALTSTAQDCWICLSCLSIFCILALYLSHFNIISLLYTFRFLSALIFYPRIFHRFLFLFRHTLFLLYKKLFIRKMYPSQKKFLKKIRNFLGFIQIFMKLFREILCIFDLFQDNLADFSP